jgi:CelD/BcsL family acetyltransferase involved in cellulose biosynthesis
VIAELDALRGRWTALAEDSRNVFSTWEWAVTWWRHFGAGHELRTSLAVDADGSPLAIMPLYVRRRRPRILRFIGHGPADELGPVCRADRRAAAARALREELSGSGADLLLAEQLPSDAAWPGALGGSTLRHEASPCLPLAGVGWDAYLASRTRSFREQIRRRERALSREHDARFRLADERTLSDDLGALFALHRARFAHTTSTFQHEGFHRDFAATALERKWLRLWLLEVGGTPAAAWYGFRFGGIETYYQAGRDPAWERWSVGLVLLVHTIREAVADGMLEYRFGRGDEAFKYRFTSADPGLDTFAVGAGAVGSTLAAALRAARKAPWLRSALRRLSQGV